MKMMEHELCSKDLPVSERYGSMWLNTWELFLEDDYDQMVKKLIISLFSQMEEYFEKAGRVQKSNLRRKKIREYARSISAMVCSTFNMESKLSEDVYDMMFSGKSKNTVSAKRQEFDSYLDGQVKEHNNGITDKAFLIFVDDLDRLEPVKAITLLEALKNLFELHNCVFILAIDYDVISKGVEQKYGSLHLTNRNISQEFFDKLIQVPYMLPVQNYDIRNMVLSRLDKIGFFPSPEDREREKERVLQIVTLATKKNPRAIKRLTNMIHLAEMIGGNQKSISFKMMELLLMSLQLSFHAIYSMVCQQGDLKEWLQEQNQKNLYQLTPWEEERYHLDTPLKKAIYHLTSKDEVLFSNYYRISPLLDFFEAIQNECRQEKISIGDVLGVVNIIGGKMHEQLPVRYNGAAYEQSSQTQFRQGNRLIEMLDLRRFHKVLDVGCGSGKTTMELWRKNPAMEITALDISESQLKAARKLYEQVRNELPDASGSVVFEEKDACSLRCTDQFDLVFSNATLHWIRTPEKMYTLLFQALKPGGTLAVHQGGEGTYEGLHQIARQAIKEAGLSDLFQDWEFPAFYPTKSRMESMLKEIGYTDISVESVFCDEKDNQHLIDNFATASLIFYQDAGLSDSQFDALRNKYFEICSRQPVNKASHRLYILATKPKEESGICR